MNELIKMITDKAGISEGQATIALQVVMGQLRDKLPAPIATQLEGLLGTQSSGKSSGLEGLMGSLGSSSASSGELLKGLGGLLGK